MKRIGLYIHVPFCKSKCPYCDFYSMRSDGKNYDAYTDKVIDYLREWSEWDNYFADTLYFGGGTPSLVGGKNIARIVNEAKKLFDIAGEITVECNPSANEEDFFETVAQAGVNRISLGMQSAVDSERRKLGRLADRDKVADCIRRARLAEIKNISLDVMLGVPDQTIESLRETVDFCIANGVEHISAYMLKLEEGTYYYNNADKLNLPDEDETADMYLYLAQELEKNGFVHYEISNFAKPGFESRHNLKYWNCEEYLGIGPSAHSFLGSARLYYPADMEYFLEGKEILPEDAGGSVEEYIMLRLRLSDGVVFKDFERVYDMQFPEEFIERAEPFVDKGFVRLTSDSLSLTREGFLLSNTIISELIYG